MSLFLLFSFEIDIKRKCFIFQPSPSQQINLGPSSNPHAKPSDFHFLKVIGKGSFGKVISSLKTLLLSVSHALILHPPCEWIAKKKWFLIEISGSSSKTQSRRSVLCSQSFTEESDPEKEGGMRCVWLVGFEDRFSLSSFTFEFWYLVEICHWILIILFLGKAYYVRAECSVEECETPFPGGPSLLFPDGWQTVLCPWLH